MYLKNCKFFCLHFCGDAALEGDPRSPFERIQAGRKKIFGREPDLRTQDRRRFKCNHASDYIDRFMDMLRNSESVKADNRNGSINKMKGRFVVGPNRPKAELIAGTLCA